MKSYKLNRLRDLLVESVSLADELKLPFLTYLVRMALLHFGEELEELRKTQPNLIHRYNFLRDLDPALAHHQSNVVGRWDWDVQNDILKTPPPVAMLFGLDPCEAGSGLPQKEYDRAIHPKDSQRLKNAIEHTLATGAPFNIVYRIVHADKGIRWILAVGRAIVENGEVVRFPGTIMDITDDENRRQQAIDHNGYWEDETRFN